MVISRSLRKRGETLRSDMESNLTEEELAHSDNMLQGDWQKEFDYAGGFQTRLMKTIMYADDVNLKKLGIVYPSLVGAFKNRYKKKERRGDE